MTPQAVKEALREMMDYARSFQPLTVEGENRYQAAVERAQAALESLQAAQGEVVAWATDDFYSVCSDAVKNKYPNASRVFTIPLYAHPQAGEGAVIDAIPKYRLSYAGDYFSGITSEENQVGRWYGDEIWYKAEDVAALLSSKPEGARNNNTEAGN